ncbi:MAG TPA: CheR family methyltransferase, partial [Myxococcaceae bacterium]|nr:CheR family methyltransferase [Myxococcaceae bacterium]
DYQVQIFATDLDDDAVAAARRGIYPANIALDVDPERLRRFFVQREEGYEVSRHVRDLVVFATQDVTKDAPFSRLDLVTCRNLLIYLQSVLQKKVLKILHYALNPGGYLVLGTSETVGDAPDLFTLVDKRNKIYEKKNIAVNTALKLGFGPSVQHVRPAVRQVPNVRPMINVQQLADRKILERFAPPGVIINENLDVLQFRGRTGGYFEPSPGTATLNLLKLARPELHLELRSVIHKALTGDTGAVSGPVTLRDGESARKVRVEALPLRDPESGGKCLLLMFQEGFESEALPVLGSPAITQPSEDLRIQDLSRELVSTKEYLQNAIEELETANEELQSSNEELQSSNEELQSTNEELETSKEELQSTNEELSTVNDELQNRMEELSLSNDDLQNLLAVVEEPVLLVGMDLRVRRFTFSAEKLFNLVGADVGRSVSLLRSFFPSFNAENVCSEVIDRVAPFVADALATDGRWYHLRAVPYTTADHAIRGVVLRVTDVHGKNGGVHPSLDVGEYAQTV